MAIAGNLSYSHNAIAVGIEDCVTAVLVGVLDAEVEGYSVEVIGKVVEELGFGVEACVVTGKMAFSFVLHWPF